MHSRLIVMSVDAMVFEDLEYLSTLPHFSTLLQEGSRVEKMRTIYPSLTHPIHVSLLTGCYPEKTGIPNNTLFVPGNTNPPWYNDLSQIQVPTIFHAAKEKGLSTCACRWPVTSQKPGENIIDYLIPEILEDTTGEVLLNTYRSQGTSEELIQQVLLPCLSRQDPDSPRHPAYDTLEIQCACEIIKRHCPDLLFTHPGQVDSARHENGLFNTKVTQALQLADQYLGMLMDAAKEAGVYEETNFVVLSDHGHLSITREICPNIYLKEKGLLQTDEKGNLQNWDAYVQEAGLSAHVYLKNPADSAVSERVYRVLLEMKENSLYGISSVYTAEEASQLHHLSGDFSFVLESDGFSAFSESCTGQYARPLSIAASPYGHSTHGHLPEKGPQPPFLCMGPAFQKHVVLPAGKIVDVAPTLAKAMGLALPQAQGEPMESLLA